MNRHLKSALAVSALVLATQAVAQVTFYEGEGYRGRAFSTSQRVGDFSRAGFNDRASSVVVDRGRWEVCERPRFEGRCAVLRRGNYPDLRGTGLQWEIASIRPARDGRRAARLADRRPRRAGPQSDRCDAGRSAAGPAAQRHQDPAGQPEL